jgi:post-segregation antitoxin (ccd killing protein)
MTKVKISVSVTPERLDAARRVLPDLNVSELVEQGLSALVEAEFERRWMQGHADSAGRDVDLPGAVPADLSHIPWEDE